MRGIRSLLAVLLLLSLALVIGPKHQARAVGADVLVLDTTITAPDYGGTYSSGLEVGAAAALSLTADIVDTATWSSMTTADFAAYKAIILGDPTCAGPGTYSVTAAEANAGVWGPAVTGNVVVIGTDPTYHAEFGPGSLYYGGGGAGPWTLINTGVAFATSAPGKTGAYITLSCYYHDTAPSTPVPLLSTLSTFGGFTVTGVGCYNDSHIVATHPAIIGLTDGDLSGWSCSVHEAFDGFPSDFLPLAIARDPVGEPPLPGSLPFPDGSSGVPYVMARGEGLVLISDVQLEPLTAVNEIGTTHTVTASVTQNGSPLAGVTVDFTVTGANSASGSAVTDGAGMASFTYAGTSEGIDTIVASFTDADGKIHSSNPVTKEWVKPADSTPPTGQCIATTNPSGKNVPTAGKNPKSGQNPDGFYQLLGDDDVAVASIVVKDSGSAFVSNPFTSGDKVKITQAPGVAPSDTRPGPGGMVSHLQLKGDAILQVTDTSGNVTKVSCLVAPLPK